MQLNLFHETEKNVESWHVMHQRNVLDRFEMTVYQSVQEAASFTFSSALEKYGRDVGEYNRLMDDFKKYEAWYTSDINNKASVNAKELHAKKNAVSEKFKTLLDVIQSAENDIERQLLADGILKIKSRWLK